MKKQVLAGILLATMMVGISANDSYAEYNEYRGTVPENWGDLNSPFVITEVNLSDNYLKVIYNGGMEGEVKLRNVDILTWNPETEGEKGTEDYFDWLLPSIHYSTPAYAHVVYNKSQYLFGDKFAKGAEETITGSEMHKPLSDSPNMKLYYSLYIGPNTQAASFYTGKINYERCAGSRVFNREEMTCKVEVKTDGSGIQYQPYVIVTGERVEVPEDYEVVEPEPESEPDLEPEPEPTFEPEPIVDDGGGGVGEVVGNSEAQQMSGEVSVPSMSALDLTEQMAVAADVRKSAGVVATTSTIEEEMVVATPVNKKENVEIAGTTEVLERSLEPLGDATEDEDDGENIWGVLVGILGAAGALVAGWWLFLLVKRRKEKNEQ